VRGKNVLWTCFIALLLTSALLAGTVMVTSPSLPKIYVDPSSVEDKYYPETFTVNITVNGVTDLYAWEFWLSFAPSVLKVVSVTQGPFLKEVGEEWYGTYFSKNINNPYGYMTAGAMLLNNPDPPYEFPPEGATGAKGVLATILFQVIGEGVCVLDLWDTELDTVTGEVLDPIPHNVADGLFDNRLWPTPPIANFTVAHPGMIVPVAGLPITFNASASKDDGWIINYGWDFGDGATGTGKIVDHVFAAVGAYTVSLTVTDNDNDTDTMSKDITVVEWMEGGTFPDILDARPECEPWNEVCKPKGREIGLFGLVGNPTGEPFEVYVEFTVYSTETAAKLGTINTDPVIIGGGQTLELSAIMDLRDTRWRVGPNRGPYWALKNLVQPSYTVFAKCYHRPVDDGEFEEGLSAKDFGFRVRGAKHDIAVLEVTTNATDGVPGGSLLEIYVTIANEGGGHFVEPFTMTVTYKGLTTSGTVEVRSTELQGDEIRTETFILDTSEPEPGKPPLPAGPYLITATLSVLTYEMDALDNSARCLIQIT